MIRPLRRRRHVSASPLKGALASLVLHAGALALLAGWSNSLPDEPARFAGSLRVITASLAPAKPAPPPAVELTSPGEPVEITPRAAKLARHRYVDMPSAEIRVAELVDPELWETALAVATTTDSQRRETEQQPQEPNAQPPRPVNRNQPSPRPPAPASPASLPQTLGTDDTIPPDFAGNRPPSYPETARQRGWEGTVLLRLIIGADGRVSRVEVARSSGHEILDAEAVNAVRSWRGQPATRRGKPIESIELLPVVFRLR